MDSGGFVFSIAWFLLGFLGILVTYGLDYMVMSRRTVLTPTDITISIMYLICGPFTLMITILNFILEATIDYEVRIYKSEIRIFKGRERVEEERGT